MLLWLLSCTANDDDTSVEPVYPDIPTAQCGADHDWVDLNQTGKVLATNALNELSLEREGVGSLLSVAGLEGVEPVYGVDVEQVRYSSQDRGALIEASGLVVTPRADGEFPLLVWLHPTAGFSPDCGPSGRGLEGAAFPMLYASLGYVVVAPDYVGMNGWAEPSSPDLHPYIAAEPTAVASLDAARAALDMGAPADPSRTVFYGVSEGGFAALVSDQYAAALAPELTPVAVLAIVPPTDITALAVRGTGEFSDTTGGLAAVVATQQQWYGAPSLESVLQPAYAEGLQELLGEACTGFELGDPQAVEDLFTPEFIDAWQNDGGVEPWDCIWEENSPRTSPVRGASTAPIVLVTGQDDDLAWTPPVRDTVPEYCAAGRDVLYRECEGADHVSAAVDTLVWQIDTLEGLMSGAIDADCVVSEPEPCSTD